MLVAELLSPTQVAERCNVTYRTVFNWIKSGKLKAKHAGKQVRIEEADLEAFLTDYPIGGNTEQSPRRTQAD